MFICYSACKSLWAVFKVGHIHPFIPFRVAEGWRLSQHELEERQDTPWTGLTHTLFTTTVQPAVTDFPKMYTSGLWVGGGGDME